MYAAVSTGQIYPEQLDEVEHVMRETVFPILKTVDGLKHRYGMIDRTTGKYVVVNLYETEEAARTGGTRGQLEQIGAALDRFLVTPSQREVYEVMHELEL